MLYLNDEDYSDVIKGYSVYINELYSFRPISDTTQQMYSAEYVIRVYKDTIEGMQYPNFIDRPDEGRTLAPPFIATVTGEVVVMYQQRVTVSIYGMRTEIDTPPNLSVFQDWSSHISRILQRHTKDKFVQEFTQMFHGLKDTPARTLKKPRIAAPNPRLLGLIR